MIRPVSGLVSAGDDPHRGFAARILFDDPVHVVELSGELDGAVRADAFRALTSANHVDVLVDMSGLRYMDCAGYSALAASKLILERRRGSMVLLNPVGEPRRLLTLIDERDLDPCVPVRYGNRVDASRQLRRADALPMTDGLATSSAAVPPEVTSWLLGTTRVS